MPVKIRIKKCDYNEMLQIVNIKIYVFNITEISKNELRKDLNVISGNL